MLTTATAAQLRVLQQVPRLAAACVRALHYWLTEASDEEEVAVPYLVILVAGLAGFDVVQLERWGTQPPAATADTAAARAALRGGLGIEGALRRFLSQQPPDEDGSIESARWAAKWLLRLPEVNAAAAAAPKPAAAEVAAAAATAAAAAAAAMAAAGERAVPQQPQPGAGSSGSGADGSGSSGSGAGGASGSGAGSASGSGAGSASGSGAGSVSSAETDLRPRACGECGKSGAGAPLLRCVGCKAQYYCGEACAMAHWPAHRAACKAARAAKAAQRS
ncbi:hypothetical protein Rsub_07304 [Raphidocelis subcapitata]|uniref:MYND-type domain-containing protein n=1 Tax=Raphidocelis subcapitata TaxID=307507 RepID=A0A2V0P2F1_9CHLO|nr:hypothetical protein Rsub_07304 [Raphidocelis subcapitata]|eukprot:GBF94036.1 hypothetical protein Rsub_07304 [Raphidocelis subcapitata]